MNTLPLVIDPIALHLGPIKVTWYGLILGLGAVFGLFLAVREGKRFHLSPDFFMDLLLIGVPSAIIGARIYYVAFEWEQYKGDWYEIIAIWHGGIAIHGALIGAVLAGIIYTRVKRVNFWRIADIAAPSLIAGQMIGRWGNFVNQEAHGGPVSREFLSDTLHLPDWIVNQMQIGDAHYHPTFLYESLWNLAVLLVLLWLRRRAWLKAGELFVTYFALYSVGRFFIEGLRTDSLTFHGPGWLEGLLAVLWSPMELVFEAGELPPGGGNVRMAQLISLLLILASVLLIAVRRIGGFAGERYLDPIVFGTRGGAGDNDGNPDGGNGGKTDAATERKADGEASGSDAGSAGTSRADGGPDKREAGRAESGAGAGASGALAGAGPQSDAEAHAAADSNAEGGSPDAAEHAESSRKRGIKGKLGWFGHKPAPSDGHADRRGRQAGEEGDPMAASERGNGVPAGETAGNRQAGTEGGEDTGRRNRDAGSQENHRDGSGPGSGPDGGIQQGGTGGYQPPRYEPGNPLL